MTNQQAPEIYTLHTVPNKGERPWSGIYALRADAEHDAKVMHDATGRDWSVVRLVVADTATTPTGPITRYEVVDCIDSKHVPAVIPNGAGPWVRYEDHLAALVDAQQPAPTPQADSQPAATGRIAELEDALSSCLQLVNQLNEHHIPDGCSRLIRHIKDAAATVSKAQARAAAESQPEPVREHDLQDVRCECCGYMTYHLEHMGCIRAARAPAQSVLEDAARWQWLADYLIGERTDLDEGIVACATIDALRQFADAARKQGGA